MTNILINSAGRRVELVEAFMAEAARARPGTKVFAADLNPGLSSACHAADQSFAMPPVGDPGYVDALAEACRTNDIEMVIPTIDTDLLLLADARDAFAERGTHVIVSSPDLVRMCRDKRRTESLFARIGVPAPRLMDRSALEFPCFAKPVSGSSGVGARFIGSRAELSPGDISDDDLMFSEFIDGSYDEYTVDAYFDREGRVRCVVPRLRLAVRAGEVAKGVTRYNYVHDILVEQLPALDGARGCMTVQVFARETDRTLFGIEINPRFGGGYPLSYAAGANFPGMLIAEYLLGREAQDFDRWEANLLMLRYDAKKLVRDHA